MTKKQHLSIFPNSIIELEMRFLEQGFKKPFLVTGKNSFVTSGAKKAMKSLFDKYEIVHFNDFQVNPDSKEVEKGVQLFQSSACDCIISVGGGSVMDMAKLINYYHIIEPLSITEESIKNPNNQFISHIAIPTTAGSGAESTHFAVMYIGNKKYSVDDFGLLPDFVIIDPEFHTHQSNYQKAVSGVDAVAQAIEALWSINATPLSSIYAENALRLLWNNLSQAIEHNDMEAHLNVAVGANLAGRAINITKTTAPHALSYGFTKMVGLPHGHAVALSLPYFLNLHSQVTPENCNAPQGKEFVDKAIKRIDSIISLTQNPKALTDFMTRIGIEMNIRKLNINADICKKVIENVNLERLANNPVKMDKEELFDYYMSLGECRLK